jgi:hypothetical protein
VEFDPIPLVQQKKRYSEFKITPIGGPDEIEMWRSMQEAKATTHRMRLGERDQRLIDFETQLAQTLDRGSVKSATWEEKTAHVALEKALIKDMLSKVTEHPPWEAHVEPKKPILKRVAGFFKRIWSDANF